jgi:YggT family protein
MFIFLRFGLDLFFSLLILLFISRLIMTWYPELDLNRLPYKVVAWPTEVVLRPTRRLVPLFGGVDMSPFVWVAILAFIREILIGQQGLITLLAAHGY